MSTPIISQPTEQQALFIDALRYRLRNTLEVQPSLPSRGKLIHASNVARDCLGVCLSVGYLFDMDIDSLTAPQRADVMSIIDAHLITWSRPMRKMFSEVFSETYQESTHYTAFSAALNLLQWMSYGKHGLDRSELYEALSPVITSFRARVNHLFETSLSDDIKRNWARQSLYILDEIGFVPVIEEDQLDLVAPDEQPQPAVLPTALLILAAIASPSVPQASEMPADLRIAAESAAVQHGIPPALYVQFIESGHTWQTNPAQISLDMTYGCGLFKVWTVRENLDCGAMQLSFYASKAGSVTAGIQAFCAASKLCGGVQ